MRIESHLVFTITRLIEACEAQRRALTGTPVHQVEETLKEAKLTLQLNTLGTVQSGAQPLRHVLLAVVRGKTVQQWISGSAGGRFEDLGAFKTEEVIGFILDYPERPYRVKPDPVVSWGGMGAGGQIDGYADEEEARRQCKQRGIKLLRIVSDPETHAIIAAETETP